MQYTIRNVPKAVDNAFRAKAKAEGKSLNQLAIEALAQRAGVGSVVAVPKRDLSFMRTHPDDVRAIRLAHKLCD
jgi:plasmid stability protein